MVDPIHTQHVQKDLFRLTIHAERSYHEDRLTICQQYQLIERLKDLRRWLMDRRDDSLALQRHFTQHLDQIESRRAVQTRRRLYQKEQ